MLSSCSTELERCPMRWGRSWNMPMIVHHCRIRTVLDEQAYDIYVSRLYRHMQQGRPVLVPGCRIRAVLDE